VPLSRESPRQCRRSRPEAISGSAAGRGHDRAPQRLAVAHKLVEIRCTNWNLGDRPVADRGADCRHVHLQEEVSESRIRWWPPQFNLQLLAKHRMVAPSETLQISQAFAAAQDAEHGHQKQVPSGNTNSSPHPGIGDRLEEADQIEIGCSRAGFGHRDGASPLSEPNTGNSGQRACDTI